MKIETHTLNNIKIAIISSDKELIRTVEDGLDLIGNLSYQGYDKVIIHEENIIPDFFELKNKLAGEILQKFVQYRLRLTIVGEFTKLQSKSLHDFIFESNKGSQVNFVATIDEALNI